MTPVIEVYDDQFGRWIEREDTHHRRGDTESTEAQLSTDLLNSFPGKAREIADGLGDPCNSETHTISTPGVE